MNISINTDKLLANKKLFTSLNYKLLLKMIEDTDNHLYGINLDKNHIAVTINKKNQLLVKVHKLLIMLTLIPASLYSALHSDVELMLDVYVDFRFERLFQKDRDMYVKFFQLYSSGRGIYAPLKNGNYIRITPNLLKQCKKSSIKNPLFILPLTWRKYVKIIKVLD